MWKMEKEKIKEQSRGGGFPPNCMQMEMTLQISKVLPFTWQWRFSCSEIHFWDSLANTLILLIFCSSAWFISNWLGSLWCGSSGSQSFSRYRGNWLSRLIRNVQHSQFILNLIFHSFSELLLLGWGKGKWGLERAVGFSFKRGFFLLL